MFHSKQWHYGLHRDFQKLHSTHSTQRSPRDSSNSTFYIRVPIQNSMLHAKDKELFIQSRKDILYIEGKEIFEYIHSSYKAFQIFQTFQTFQSFMTFSLPGISTCSSTLQYIPVSSSTSSTFQYIQDSTPLQHSPIRMHILHILHFDWFPQKLHRVPVETLHYYKLSFFKEREMLRYRSKYVSRIS